MPNSVQSAFVNPLDPSSRAACWLGPDALMPARVRSSTITAAHDELYLMVLTEIDHRGMIGDVERHTFGLARNAGIARRAPEFGHQRRGRDLPRQSVFAAAGTEQKNVHGRSQSEGCGFESVARISPSLQEEFAVIPDGAQRRSGISSLSCATAPQFEIPGSLGCERPGMTAETNASRPRL